MAGKITTMPPTNSSIRLDQLAKNPGNATSNRAMYRGPNALRFSVYGFSVINTSSSSNSNTQTRLNNSLRPERTVSCRRINKVADGRNSRHLFTMSDAGDAATEFSIDAYAFGAAIAT